MEIKGSVTQMIQTGAKFIQGPCCPAQRNRDLHAFAKVESFQCHLVNELRIVGAKVAHYTAEIAAKCRNGDVIPDIKRRKLFRQSIAIRVRQRPLRKIVRKAFRQEVVSTQRLKCVVKNGRVAALLKTGEKLGNRSSGLVADPCQVRNRKEFKRGFCCVHARAASSLVSAVTTSAGPRRWYCAQVGCLPPTRTETPLRTAAKAGSSERSSPK